MAANYAAELPVVGGVHSAVPLPGVALPRGVAERSVVEGC